MQTISQPTLPNTETHEVTNQVPENSLTAWQQDLALQRCLTDNQATWGIESISSYAQKIQSNLAEDGVLANQFTPTFRPHNHRGQRINQVDFHESYHRLMSAGKGHQLHSLPWQSKQDGRHSVRSALSYLHNQADFGTHCPITMTFAAVPVLQKHPELNTTWLPKILNTSYDPSNRPWWEKSGLTIGMAMTEKQGGSDVRQNTTQATALPDHPDAALLTGHKWFCSAPMCDGFLMLAYEPQGMSCFLVPRWRPDGQLNGIYIQQLKNKLGNRSNASSEIELRDAFGWRLGEAGLGIQVIIEMVMLTRYDCLIGSSAMMAQGAHAAIHHALHRTVFGKTLIDQPMMRAVLADLLMEVEASVALTFRLAKSLDNASNAHEQSLLRLMTAVGKFWICKRATSTLAEAQECLGGLGYIEDSIMPRLVKEAPVNAIWEGSGNVQCMDVLRALRNPEVVEAFYTEIAPSMALSNRLNQRASRVMDRIKYQDTPMHETRHLVSEIALCFQAHTLFAQDSALGEAFVHHRLSGENQGWLFGGQAECAPSRQLLDQYAHRMLAG